jgi:uncharacterized RDD family membrane protein YckC
MKTLFRFLAVLCALHVGLASAVRADAVSVAGSEPAKKIKADARVSVGRGVTLGADETVDAVVAVFGSVTSAGTVREAVVAVGGDAEVTGPVSDSVVTVLGRARVNGRVAGEVVAVLGDVELGPDADVMGDVVAIGGDVIRDPKARVGGHVQQVMSSNFMGGLKGLHAWFTHCLLLARPLAFAPQLGWAWGVALACLGLYLMLALIFRGAVERCVTTFEIRPVRTLVAALLATVLAPLVSLLLLVSVVGIVVLPFFLVGVLVAMAFGKTALLAFIGRRVTGGRSIHPAWAALLGGVIVLLLYVVPFVGLLVFKLLTWLGTGLALYALMLAFERERPAPVAPVPSTATPTPVPPAPVSALALEVAPMDSPQGPAATAVPPVPPVIPPAPAPAVALAHTLPRAGFLIRLGALFIDLVVVSALTHFLVGVLSPYLQHAAGGPPFVALALYAALLWKLKGTTLGGIVCGLKVVRLDGREVDWATAIVRALGCFLSFLPAGLGFLWVEVGDEKQSWHDRLAGTTVVRVPKGTSLV